MNDDAAFYGWKWPDDLWRMNLKGEDVLRILGSNVTFIVELNSGEKVMVNPACGDKLKLTPADFKTVTEAALWVSKQ